MHRAADRGGKGESLPLTTGPKTGPGFAIPYPQGLAAPATPRSYARGR